MRPKIKYIELKSGYGHDGPAWIGLVSFSKSGRTIYFDGKAFQKIGSDRMLGNYYDVESGNEYWISGVKKDMSDRHWYGTGKILVEQRVLEDYLKIIKQPSLDKKRFEVCSVIEALPLEKIHEIENTPSEPDETKAYKFKDPSSMTDDELDYFIKSCEEHAVQGRYLKGRKHSRQQLKELEQEKEKRMSRLS